MEITKMRSLVLDSDVEFEHSSRFLLIAIFIYFQERKNFTSVSVSFMYIKSINQNHIINKMSKDQGPKIRVLIRKRPISKKQLQKGDEDIVKVLNHQTVVVREQKVKVDLTPYTDEYKFNFDGAYDSDSTNEQIYENEVKPLVQCAFDGARVSCFAYGQTGSGKTYTMLGDGQEVHGLYVLAACDIFDLVVKRNDLEVWVSFYEIYCGKLFDLLNNRNILVAREDAKNKVNIVGLSQRRITNVKNLMQAIEFGTSSRVTAENGTNVDSSRSHAILQISLKNGKKVHGKVSFIDLAGSERAADHADQTEKQTRIDGAEINKSLLALKECIRALDQNKNHTPFRGSKLTMVLKDSFTGYCKTVMIGNISPNSSSSQNTLNTLKYADRVKELKKPIKDACQPADGDNLDELSKQLMLPRQLVNHTRYRVVEDVDSKEDLNKSAVVAPSKRTPIKTNTIYAPSKKTDTVKKDKQNTTLSNTPIKMERGKQKENRNNNVTPIANKRSITPNINPRQQIVQQKLKKQPQSPSPSPEDYPSYKNYEELSQLHQSIVTHLFQEQQKLVKHHSCHVKTAVELVKKEMQLLLLAEDPDANMQEYAVRLDYLLQMQIESLLEVRGQVHKVLKSLKKSEDIEKIYVEETNKLNELEPEDEVNLLQGDELLFRQ